MNHPILGKLKTILCHPFDAVATIHHGSREIKVGISRDDQSLEISLQLAANVVQRLAELDVTAKQVACRDLRETYNDNWAEFLEAQQDGSLKEVSDPKLSEDEFEAKLTLNAVNVNGDCGVDFFYDDEGMFSGHSVCVMSTHGTDFSEAWADMLG